MSAGHPVTVDVYSSLADGLAVPRVGDHAFAVARSRVDRVVAVSERDIAVAILRLLEVTRWDMHYFIQRQLGSQMKKNLKKLDKWRETLIKYAGKRCRKKTRECMLVDVFEYEKKKFNNYRDDDNNNNNNCGGERIVS